MRVLRDVDIVVIVDEGVREDAAEAEDSEDEERRPHDGDDGDGSDAAPRVGRRPTHRGLRLLRFAGAEGGAARSG